ncbi:Hcp family type VI secretion system effector [Devosia nitrariae]|uniref:Type VI secretion system tube protein Hcp n=1 Tax=Devosia nitrariae TaxID=2071872 RepID=A0ABQ5WD33_9HYPH|nr:type VI secretion system tube protein Hcp [Devosia nitrariae]GLQ58033.1 hypothetical protein GCM10010862_52920 [Devosia nitrariae]
MAVDTFLKLGDIKGESQADKHKDEIEVLSWSWGASQQGTFGSGGGGGAGKVTVSDLVFTKFMDKASPVLFLHCATGKHIPSAQLTLRKAGEEQLEYHKVILTDVLISSYQTGGSGGGDERPVDNVSLNFGKVELEFSPQNEKGTLDAAVKAGFDLKTSKKT